MSRCLDGIHIVIVEVVPVVSTCGQRGYFVDLFAGSGGLSLGLEQAGFTPILVNEISHDAMETYLRNREESFPLLRHKYHVSDVRTLTTNGGQLLQEFIQGFRDDYGINVESGELDLLVGGPPCQGYSRIGHRRIHTVSKRELALNHLYLHMIESIKRLQPRLFLFENVLGLTTAKWTSEGDKGEVWDDVLASYRSLGGYHVEPWVVHAKDYGVPQNRPRILIVGLREDISFEARENWPAFGLLPLPTATAPNIEDVLSDLIDLQYENGDETLHYPGPPQSSVQRLLRCNPLDQQISREGDLLTEHKYSRHSERIIQKFSAIIASGGYIPPEHRTRKFSQRLLPATWDAAGPNITVTSLTDDYVHYAQPRTLTVREWARLQTFPDWYQFAGPRTTGGLKRAGRPSMGINDREVPKYTQIGNAVPVAMARAFGTHFMKLLRNHAINGTEKHQDSSQPGRLLECPLDTT